MAGKDKKGKNTETETEVILDFEISESDSEESNSNLETEDSSSEDEDEIQLNNEFLDQLHHNLNYFDEKEAIASYAKRNPTPTLIVSENLIQTIGSLIDSLLDALEAEDANEAANVTSQDQLKSWFEDKISELIKQKVIAKELNETHIKEFKDLLTNIKFYNLSKLKQIDVGSKSKPLFMTRPGGSKPEFEQKFESESDLESDLESESESDSESDSEFPKPSSKKEPVYLASKFKDKSFFEFIKKETLKNRGKDNTTIESKKITVQLSGSKDPHNYTVTPEANSNSAIYIPHKVKGEAIPTNEVLASMCEDAVKVAQSGQVFTITQGTPQEQEALYTSLRGAIFHYQQIKGNESFKFIIKCNEKEEEFYLDKKGESKSRLVKKPEMPAKKESLSKKQAAEKARAEQEERDAQAAIDAVARAQEQEKAALALKAAERAQEIERANQYKIEVEQWVDDTLQEFPEGYNWITADTPSNDIKVISEVIRAKKSKISINGLPVAQLLEIGGIGNNCLPNVMVREAIFKHWDKIGARASILIEFKKFYNDSENNYNDLEEHHLKVLYDGLSPADQEKIFGPVIRKHMAFRLSHLGEAHKDKFMQAFDTQELNAKSGKENPKHPLYKFNKLYNEVRANKHNKKPIKTKLKEDFVKEYYKCFGDHNNIMTTTDFDLKVYANLLGFKVKIYDRDFVFQNPTADDLCVVVNELPTQASMMELNKVYLNADGSGEYVLKTVSNGPISKGSVFDYNLVGVPVTSENESQWKKGAVQAAAIQHAFLYNEENEFKGNFIGDITLYNQGGNHWECVAQDQSASAIPEKLSNLDELHSIGEWTYNNLNPLREVINDVLKLKKAPDLETKTHQDKPKYRPK